MKVCAVMVWYDESTSWLGAATAGVARIVDHIVAVDGAYALYPGARPRSHPEQADAILSAAEACAVGCTIHRPNEVFWGNEVEKRNLSLRLAAPFLTPLEDWVLVMDADYLVMDPTTPELVRETLEHTEHNVVTYTIVDGKDLLADEGSALAARMSPLSTDWTLRERGLFRWTDDMRYGPAHYFLRGTYNGEQQWLRGPDLFPTEGHRAAETDHLGRRLVMWHRRGQRAQVRQLAADNYYKIRDEHEAELVNEMTVA